ncbi:hypothetical protein EG68_04630 [Paragonimus skrjabini miyazakii]|uniref:Secreted protein n=1 Tax=Paragonimus skrjabini miyazakii TaxID=59628 RepID=A0A8S9YDL1_9TREM|nr:hypothetical protein EG68_04630 [Paragonimus skrjabini miyazakii]
MFVDVHVFLIVILAGLQNAERCTHRMPDHANTETLAEAIGTNEVSSFVASLILFPKSLKKKKWAKSIVSLWTV